MCGGDAAFCQITLTTRLPHQAQGPLKTPLFVGLFPVLAASTCLPPETVHSTEFDRRPTGYTELSALDTQRFADARNNAEEPMPERSVANNRVQKKSHFLRLTLCTQCLEKKVPLYFCP